MSDIPDLIDVRPALRFDSRALQDWMAGHVSVGRGPLQIKQFAGGQSNPTYLVHTPEQDYVLRRKPPGPLLKGAHAIEREARVMQALRKADFPVPRVHALCEDESIIGSAFYLMDRVPGRVFWDASFGSLPLSERAAHFDAMNATLARLHQIDPARIGLQDYGRPGQYVQRQVARWSSQYREDDLAGRNDDMDCLADWLPAHLPDEDEAAIVHGDFRVDNMIFHPQAPRVLAVLDWELSTLGHPLSDFAYHVMMYRLPPDILGGLQGVDLAAAGLPSEAAYVRAYCERTGRQAIPDLDVYIAFNLFRFAAILHGIRGRAARGTASSAQAAAMSANLERVAAIGWTLAQRVKPRT